MFSKLFDVITEQKPKRIGVAFDDWPTFAAEIDGSKRDSETGKFKEPGRFSHRVTYEPGDDYVYMMGVFVYRDFSLNRGELKVEAA